MKNTDAIKAFLALGQETRLNIFRLVLRYLALTQEQLLQLSLGRSLRCRSWWGWFQLRYGLKAVFSPQMPIQNK